MSRSLTAIRHLEKEALNELLERSAFFRTQVRSGVMPVQTNKTIGLLFFEGSTRTRVSFEQAANFSGIRFTNFVSQGSSMAKGETFRDTILTLKAERLDALVIRHPGSGSAHLASRIFERPVINAGDGKHEHPTQALGDALTIIENKGDVEGLVVAIVGDVAHSRVARSNAWLLSSLGAQVRFVGPSTLIPSYTAELPGQAFYDLEAGLRGADVVMCLRLQRERMEDGLISSASEFRRMYQINATTLQWANNDALVMHPGPMNRGIEIDESAADGAQSVILEQVENCIYARMAALEWVFAEETA